MEWLSSLKSRQDEPVELLELELGVEIEIDDFCEGMSAEYHKRVRCRDASEDMDEKRL